MPHRPNRQTAEWFRIAFDELYPSLYSHRDIGEARGLLDRLGRIVPLAAGRVLDVGCGQGRYLKALVERGARPIGVDLSRPLLQRARDLLPEMPLVRADMRSLPFRRGSFRSILVMFTTFGYFSTDEEDLRVLHGLATLLDRGGHLVLDYVNAPHLRDNLVAASSRSTGGWEVEERRWIDRAGRFLHKECRVTTTTGGEAKVYRERLRLYDPGPLASMLHGVGFQIEERLGDYQGSPFDESASARLIIVARLEEENG